MTEARKLCGCEVYPCNGCDLHGVPHSCGKNTPTIEQLKRSPVLFVETFGWHPEPGYVPPWQKKLLEMEGA